MCAWERGGGSTLVLRLALSALAAAILAAIIAANFPQSAQAQTNDQVSGRIIARLLDDGRVEFGFRPVGRNDILPTSRFFPADERSGNWLRSGDVIVAGRTIGRIVARWSPSGRIEFAFFTTDGEYIWPERRYLPPNATPNRWLRSSEIAVPIAAPPPGPGPDDSGLTPSPEARKDLLAERLFGLQPGTADRLTNHGYNDFGADPGTRCGYQGGHSGWDVQTKSVSPNDGGDRRTNVPFYSLTAGKVIAVDVDTEDNTIIAVYDGKMTTLYYHARLIEVYEGADVEVGTRLGIQGRAGKWTTGVHVHVEVRDGEKDRAACGAPGSIDPIGDDYLWRSVTTAGPATTSVVRGIADRADGERIRASGMIDQYVVKQVGERRFKRLILNLNVLRAYDWTTPETVIEADVLNAVATSTLVWIADAHGAVPPGAAVYHLRPDGNTGTRHHVTAEVFAAAGLD